MSANPSLLSDYAADVERFFDAKSSVIIRNKDTSHAAVLISTLFKKAVSNIYVFSQKLDGQFYTRADIRGHLQEAVKRGVNVKVLTQSDPHNSELLEFLQRQRQSGNVSVHRCKKGSPGETCDLNFTVVDGSAYRLEIDRATHEAFACANDPKAAGDLISLFTHFDREHEELELDLNQ